MKELVEKINENLKKGIPVCEVCVGKWAVTDVTRDYDADDYAMEGSMLVGKICYAIELENTDTGDERVEFAFQEMEEETGFDEWTGFEHDTREVFLEADQVLADIKLEYLVAA